MNSLKKTILLFSFILTSLACQPAQAINPFTSDGCSSFPDGTLKQKDLWLSCCIEHDKSYWMGGTKAQRLQADKALELCVEKTGEKAIAKLMLAGVRVGGSAHLPTSFRWGYGWDFDRGYKEMSEKELEEAKALLAEYEKSQQKLNE